MAFGTGGYCIYMQIKFFLKAIFLPQKNKHLQKVKIKHNLFKPKNNKIFDLALVVEGAKLYTKTQFLHTKMQNFVQFFNKQNYTKHKQKQDINK